MLLPEAFIMLNAQVESAVRPRIKGNNELTRKRERNADGVDKNMEKNAKKEEIVCTSSTFICMPLQLKMLAISEGEIAEIVGTVILSRFISILDESPNRKSEDEFPSNN